MKGRKQEQMSKAEVWAQVPRQLSKATRESYGCRRPVNKYKCSNNIVLQKFFFRVASGCTSCTPLLPSGCSIGRCGRQPHHTNTLLSMLCTMLQFVTVHRNLHHGHHHSSRQKEHTHRRIRTDDIRMIK